MLLAESEIDRLRTQLRDMAFKPYQIKRAELGGGQDVPFEQAFSNLSHSYIKDKAPKLLDYEIGFQLVEKNGDNTKAVGVFGFKVGSQWIYAPVFFLNGDLKGHELLYIKNQDAFVPLKENWINYLLGKKPSILGDGVDRNLSRLGVMAPHLHQLSRSPHKFASAMPRLAAWAMDVMPDLAHFATQDVTTDPKYQGLKTLPDFLKEAGVPGLRFFLEKVASNYPGLLRAIDDFYGPDLLQEIARLGDTTKRAASGKSILPPKGPTEEPVGWKDRATAAGKSMWDSLDHYRRRAVSSLSRDSGIKKESTYPGCGKMRRKGRKKKASFLEGAPHTKQADDSRMKVRVYDEDMVRAHPDLIHELDAKDRQTLLKARVVIKDKRKDSEVSAAYDIQTPFKAFNPDVTGLWEVLRKPDEFVRVLVIKGPYALSGRQEYATVVTADGKGKPWCNIHPGQLWARARYDHEAYLEWFKKLPEASELKESKDQVYVLIGPSGEGTVPFMVEGSYTGGEGDIKVYDVKFLSGCTYLFPGQLPDHSYRGKRDPYNIFVNGERLILTGRPGTKLVSRDGALYVPEGYRVIKVEELDDGEKEHLEQSESQKPEEGSLRRSKEQLPPPKILDSKDGKPTERTKDQQETLTRPYHSKTLPFLPGTMADLHLMMHTHTSPLRVFSDGKDMVVNDQRKLDKTSAVIHLVFDHGLREKVARWIIGQVEKRGSFECRIKYADQSDDNDMIRDAPSSPNFPEPYRGADSFMGSNVPLQEMQEVEEKVPDMSASKTDRSIYYPQGPDPKSMQVAQQAAQTGQREVFDTAMLGSLLNAVRQESMVERYLGDLMKGMDRLGRILFQFYWHGEEFEDRYGKQDMPELEDGLRNSFEAMGDIIFALMRKSVDPYGDQGTRVDLGSLADQ